MQVRMGGWVDGRLKERLEEVFDDVFEARDLVVQLVDVVQPRDLDQPQRIVRVYLGCVKSVFVRPHDGERIIWQKKCHLI